MSSQDWSGGVCTVCQQALGPFIEKIFGFCGIALEGQHHAKRFIEPLQRLEAKLVVLDQPQDASEPDANLVKALARAHEWWGRIACGEAKGVGDIARVEGFNRAYVTRFLCLAFLAPETTKAILEGRQPTELTSKRLIRSALKTPLLWHDQIAFVLPEPRIKPLHR